MDVLTPIFVPLHAQSSAVGLTLTCASRLILLEPGLEVAKELQVPI